MKKGFGYLPKQAYTCRLHSKKTRKELMFNVAKRLLLGSLLAVTNSSAVGRSRLASRSNPMILLGLSEAMPNQPPKPPCDPPREPLIIRVPPSQIRLPEQEPPGPPDEPEMELPDEPFWIPPEMPPPPCPEDRASMSRR